MNLMIYHGKSRQAGLDMLVTLGRMPGVATVGLCGNTRDLAASIRACNRNELIVIVIALSRGELADLLKIRELLEDIPLIMILPDNTRQTFSMGNQLFPRYVGYADDASQAIRSVMKKMITKYNPKTARRQHHV